ncbi:putative transmembrane protein [Rhizoctonia solani 123E]|uniref:Putative transmembrane protein n=1 Tax=Rhizoctonia solani 123E TaxID=1423351 RepID=A0A074S7Y4_9AGAM|nr:putative transmembrane protein [Rhizoctonia solani 123E]
MAESTNNKYPPRPNAPPNQESLEMDEVDKNSTSEQEELMPKAVLEGEADDLSTWAWLSAVWLVILASCLLIFPRFLLFLSTPPGSLARESLTFLEQFLSTQLGVGLLVVSFTLVTSIPSHHPADAIQQYGVPRNHPLLIPLTTGFAFVAFLGYNKPVDEIGSLGFLVFMGNGICALYGSYLILFNGPTLRSKKTGADKHTSSFLFGNKNAASVQKKKWRKEHAK